MKESIKLNKSFGEADRLITQAIGSGLFPGCALSFYVRDKGCFSASWGRLTLVPWSPPVSASRTYFDLASLTKPFTACAIMKLVSDGIIGTDTRLEEIFHKIPADKKAITIRQLLCHASGLPAHRPLYNRWLARTKKGAPPTRQEILQEIFSQPLEYEPGTKAIYSDIGFMLLACVLEQATCTNFNKYLQKNIIEVFEVPSITDSSCLATHTNVTEIAPTGMCPEENRMIQGEVNDLNARAGLYGHAGLFGTAEGVLLFLRRLLDAHENRWKLTGFSSSVLKQFWTRDSSVPDSTWALGFDTPSATNSSAGTLFSPESVGHLGFTGTSFWIDIKKGIIVVFLSNRTFPSATLENQQGMKKFRPMLHDAVMNYISNIL